MIKLFLFICLLFPRFIYTVDYDCIDYWYSQNLDPINDKIINVKASAISGKGTSEDIILFIDKNNSQFRIDYNKQIFILDQKMFQNCTKIP